MFITCEQEVDMLIDEKEKKEGAMSLGIAFRSVGKFSSRLDCRFLF
uniref:Uncharacterized protein n=1 Tax=Rhizophora mucronata TaxID=61149 RepID=A0A2P2NA24_RHIMU